MLKSPWDLLIFICFLFLVKHNQVHLRQPIWSSAQTDNVWIDIVDTFHFPLIIIACAAVHCTLCRSLLLLHFFSTFEAEVSSVDLVEAGQGRLEARIVIGRHLVCLQNIFWINIEINFDSYNLRHLVRLQMFWIIFSKKTAIASFGKKSCSMNTWTSKWF